MTFSNTAVLVAAEYSSYGVLDMKSLGQEEFGLQLWSFDNMHGLDLFHTHRNVRIFSVFLIKIWGDIGNFCFRLLMTRLQNHDMSMWKNNIHLHSKRRNSTIFPYDYLVLISGVKILCKETFTPSVFYSCNLTQVVWPTELYWIKLCNFLLGHVALD